MRTTRLLGIAVLLLGAASLADSAGAAAAESQGATNKGWGAAVQSPAAQTPSLRARADAGDVKAALQLARQLLVAGASSQNLASGLRYLQQAADEKNASAANMLADAYRSGKFGLTIDFGLAATDYQRAADAGYGGALAPLATLYRLGGTGLAADPAKAASLYAEAIDKADSNPAREGLAQMLLDGSGVAADPGRAVDLLQQAIAKGDTYAGVILGNAYRTGRGVAADAGKAVALLTAAAGQQQVAAIEGLGDLYRNGVGTASDGEDPAKARVLYRQAADLGSISAGNKLADMLVKGEGGPADFDTGVQMLQKAVDAGNVTALMQLGGYYVSANYGHADHKSAAGYYQRVLNAGNFGALASLGNLYRQGGAGLAADPAKAATFYAEAIDKADSNPAREGLAQLLLDGSGVHADPNRAVALLQQAIAKGDAYAAELLGAAYANGRGVRPSFGRGEQAIAAAEQLGRPGARVVFAQALLNGPLRASRAGGAIAMLTTAAAQGVPGAGQVLAREELGGKVKGKEKASGIAVLVAAMNKGDVTALQALIQIYRDGAYGIPRSPQKARDLIAAHATLLGGEGAALQNLYLAASEPVDSRGLQAVARELGGLSPAGRQQALRQIKALNPGVYLGLVQIGLSAQDRYDGPVTGKLNGATVAALRQVCRDQQAADCRGDPLAPDMVMATSVALSGASFESGAYRPAVSGDLAPARLSAPKASAPSVRTIASYAPAPVAAHGARCPAAGPSLMSGISTDLNSLAPSARKSLAGIGVSAHLSGCVPRFVCVAKSSQSTDRKAAGQQCSVAFNAMFAFLTSRERKAIRTGVRIDVANAGADLQPGLTYIWLTPKP